MSCTLAIRRMRMCAGAWALPHALFQTSACPPPRSSYGGRTYLIGRTMFETDRLSREHARRCNALDEVWVPTAFHAGTFAAWGVLPAKCAAC